ncbi:type III secretion system chaperone [uncultured Gimesia sp.]|uniref:type III secretion system chaperone n=1 Tax=uncultured Gimesia sp. TaxID=1678688 RepID=UPI0026318ABF|nr:type III secretion system chaperone [uncultured Gimesia sp.]
MKITFRGWIVISCFMLVLSAMAILGAGVHAQQAASTKPVITSDAKKTGQISEEQLGNLLKAMGLTTTKKKKRFDFQFKANQNKEEWELSMSAVLSENGEWVWVMAWLDPLPRSAADVPRTAMLRLLSDNDRMGNGKFFAYVSSNRRFVLQRVIPNQDMSTKRFHAILSDLGSSVVQFYPHWSTDNWKRSTTPAPQQSAQNKPAAPTRTASGVSNFSTKKQN